MDESSVEPEPAYAKERSVHLLSGLRMKTPLKLVDRRRCRLDGRFDGQFIQFADESATSRA